MFVVYVDSDHFGWSLFFIQSRKVRKFGAPHQWGDSMAFGNRSISDLVTVIHSVDILLCEVTASLASESSAAGFTRGNFSAAFPFCTQNGYSEKFPLSTLDTETSQSVGVAS